MELNVNERLVLLGILPKEGNFLTIKIVRQLREAVSFTEEEHKVLGFRNAGEKYINEAGVEVTVPAGSIGWNPNAPQTKEIEFGIKATEIIKEALEELNKTKKLGEIHFSLYEKFVEAKEDK